MTRPSAPPRSAEIGVDRTAADRDDIVHVASPLEAAYVSAASGSPVALA